MMNSINKKHLKFYIIYTSILFLYFIMSHQLAVKFSVSIDLLNDIHLVEELLFILVSALMVYPLLKQDKEVIQVQVSQRQIEENHITLSSVLQNIPDLIYLKHKDGYWIEANAAAREFFKIEHTFYKGKTSAHIIKPHGQKGNFLSICDRTDKEAWDSKSTVRFEQTFEKADGSSRIYDVIKVPIFDMNGNPKVLVVTARDITERKLMESKLKESEKRYENLYNAIGGGITLKDRNTTVVHANKEACRILGVEPKDILSGNSKDLVWSHIKPDGSPLPPEEQPHTVVFRTGRRIRNFVMGIRHSSQSSYRWVLSNYEPVFDAPNGPPTQVLCTFLDITELKQTQERLRESEERYRLLIENLPDKIVVVSNGIFSFINREGLPLLGAQKPEQILGKNPIDFVQKNYQDYIKGILNKVEREKIVIGPSPYTLITLDGREIDVETTFIPIMFQGQTASLCMSRNIMERKKIEEALRKADTLSVAGKLAAGVAHEVRNPLTVIRGFIQLIKQQNNDNSKYFDIILTEVDRIELIISEFLMLSKPQSVVFKESNIKDIIQQTIALFETQAIMKNIEIVSVYDDNLPIIECEENQLKQVFINLLKNAMEAMPGGGTITVETKRQQEGIAIRFIDQGCGIPEEKIKKLAEPFYTTKERGTGLGLMVSYNIIKNHGGNINVKSKIGEGTTFEVFLPFNRTVCLRVRC